MKPVKKRNSKQHLSPPGPRPASAAASAFFESYRVQGFSLVELLIGLVVSTILMGALFAVLIRVQEMSAGLSTAIENRSNQHLAPLLLSQWIKCAGMNIHEKPEAFVTLRPGELAVKADIKGDHGQPDGDTEDTFENISFRSLREELKIKSGNGHYQPFLKGITGLEGNREGRSLLSVKLFRSEDCLDPGAAGFTESRLMLWNTQINLFPEKRP